MSRLAEAWKRNRKQNRFLMSAFVFLMVLSAGAFYLLQRATESTPEELTNRVLLFVLWYLDISLILILSFILLRNLLRLAVERRTGVLGSRFRTKLVFTYVGLTFVPVILIFLLATNFLQSFLFDKKTCSSKRYKKGQFISTRWERIKVQYSFIVK